MGFLRAVLFVLALTMVVGCGHSHLEKPANPPPGPNTAVLNYLSPQSFAIADLIPAPPTSEESADHSEMAQVKQAQAARTSVDCDRAKAEVKISLENFFGPPYAPLSESEIQAWTPTFNRVYADANFFLYQLKNHWKRPRPYTADSEIHPCAPLDPTFSYPSGHSTMAHLFALILSDLDPRNAALYANRAEQIANDRVLAGMHYPSDIAVGPALAERFYDSLKLSPVFMKDFDKLK